MKTIQSEILGTLTQDNHFEDWWKSEPIEIPFFNNKKIEIAFVGLIPEKDTKFIKEADEALKAFLEKSEPERLLTSPLLFEQCMKYRNAFGADKVDQNLWSLKDENKIWDFVSAENIIVTRSNGENEMIYLNLNCECEWDEEHGLQILYRKGQKLTRISEQDGDICEFDFYEKKENVKSNRIIKKWWEFWK
jgi:hypothetical protein